MESLEHKNQYTGHVIKQYEIDRYLRNGKDFIDDSAIEETLRKNSSPDRLEILDIIDKSLSLQRLELNETAALLNITDPELWNMVFDAAGDIKNRVYGPRVVTFAPLYCGNYCVNSCLYCGFRKENNDIQREILSDDNILRETEALVKTGHKRLVVAFGEHPKSNIDYICNCLKLIYSVKIGHGEIRRVNVNAAPMSIADLHRLHDVGIGTFQVFQETYHHDTYRFVHPGGIKANYQWRLYALHRALDAGVDDVGIGALFGLYDWKFDVMGLVAHTIDLEQTFDGIGPHTISFPRLEPASNAPLANNPNPYKVSDADLFKAIAVARLSVPYTGMIITARESADVRLGALSIGCTQTDASSRIGIAAYQNQTSEQQTNRQQFMLRDTRSLEVIVRELANMGYLTSFCTAGYRCGRTGKCFMNLAKHGKVHEYCIPNAMLTMKEYLIDFASPATRVVGEQVIERHLKNLDHSMADIVIKRLKEIENGARDVRF
ncbi:MAG: [FeFe] hydrogenase H-cluster radical SAM maturase HydG [Candidatus Zixiibacteriota bacterium]